MHDAPPAPRPKVRVLPPALADQIAAGEVVERPASVVKELVENALDAGARRVDVEIEAGGRRLIRVVDDGCGMTADDARLALKRHATSKIAEADDLWRLSTFGFRGEALPSIAAVSRLTLSTRPAELDGGFRLTVEAGAETEARETGMPPGTQIEVRDLFFNTPARAKFLKAEATETANVSESLLRLGLAHPGVHLRLRVAGRVALDLPVHAGLAERVRAALARRGASALHEAAGEEGGARVRAFLAGPDEVSTTPRSTFLFVGGRFVRDRSLLHALALGYGPLLEKGRYPLAALFLDLPGEEVDVNVHPQKLEVRFARAQEVYAAVRHVVGAAIARAPWLPAARSRPASAGLHAAARVGVHVARVARPHVGGQRAGGRDGVRAAGPERASRCGPETPTTPRRRPGRAGRAAWVLRRARLRRAGPPHLPGLRVGERAGADRSARRARAHRLRAPAGRARAPADPAPAAAVPDPRRGGRGRRGRRRAPVAGRPGLRAGAGRRRAWCCCARCRNR